MCVLVCLDFFPNSFFCLDILESGGSGAFICEGLSGGSLPLSIQSAQHTVVPMLCSSCVSGSRAVCTSGSVHLSDMTSPSIDLSVSEVPGGKRLTAWLESSLKRMRVINHLVLTPQNGKLRPRWINEPSKSRAHN